jgi:hypothetical protein
VARLTRRGAAGRGLGARVAAAVQGGALSVRTAGALLAAAAAGYVALNAEAALLASELTEAAVLRFMAELFPEGARF